MKSTQLLIWLCALSFNTVLGQGNVERDFTFPLLEGPYMGQQPPGLVAEPFAPGIISKEGWEIEGVFAPGMKAFYFVTGSSNETPITVIGFRQQANVWKKYIEFKRNGEISFSPDGSRMHMAKGYKDRKGDGWSDRKSLGPMFDREDWGIMRLTASSKGTYVFDDYKSDDVIRISTLKDGKRQAPQKMGPVVNSGKWTAHPFIAPDESYLIWDSEREGGYGASDLYISFRQKDGSWGPAINMGDKVNSDKWDAFASVTPDGKYILFNRAINDDYSNVDIYWVDAKIIETLRPKQIDSDFLALEDRYLGQKTPDLIPELFAPGIVSTKEHLETEVLFLPDMTELSFTRSGGIYKEPTLFVMEYKMKKWSRKPIPSTDINQYKELFSPDISEIKGFEPFKDIPIVGFTKSAIGTYYFYVLDLKDGSGHMSYSRLINGKYETPQKMSKAINQGKYIAHPFIAPDESYLMWDAEKVDEDTPDIYISFRQQDGSWGEAINMGSQINSPLYEQRPKVTPDGKYLFFWKGDVKIREDGSRYVIGSPHWVDAQIIETLRPQ